MVKVYRVAGRTAAGMRFQLEVRATKPSEALEKAYSLMGSRHGLKRGQIELALEEVRPEEASRDDVRIMASLDRVVKY